MSATESHTNLYLFTGPLSLETTLVAAHYASQQHSNLAITNNGLCAESGLNEDQELQTLNRQIFVAAGIEWDHSYRDISEELTGPRADSNAMLSSLHDWAVQLVLERSQQLSQSLTIAGAELAQCLPFWERVTEALDMDLQVHLVLPELADIQERIALEYAFDPKKSLLLGASRIMSYSDFCAQTVTGQVKPVVLSTHDIWQCLPKEYRALDSSSNDSAMTDFILLRERMRGRSSYATEFPSKHLELLETVWSNVHNPYPEASSDVWAAIRDCFFEDLPALKGSPVEDLEQLLAHDRAIRNLAYSHLQKQQHDRLTALQEQLGGVTQTLKNIEGSLIWRISAPLRMMPKSLLDLFTDTIRSQKMLEALWNCIPVSVSVRRQLKNYIFSHFFVGPMRRLTIYQEWLDWTRSRYLVRPESKQKWPVKKITRDSPLAVAGRPVEPLTLTDCSAPFDSQDTLQTIAFYLPQFHQIPENDTWWGKGFTEWTNVRASKWSHSIRTGPKTPHESIGFYDLTDSAVMHEQAALAAKFGLKGFCFYFYWFGGKTLLERPVHNYFSDKSIDFPFMLCWANENWTRSWDGMDQEVLLGQKYSAQDDIDFIKHVSKYLKDSRYIRIGDKPVLMVYRAEQLPNPCATAARWRDWCRSNGIGDIYIMGCWSFSKYDPREMGLDGALITAPVGGEVPTIEGPGFVDESFCGALHDWLSIARHSENYHNITADFDLFFTVNPAWDNSPRRGAEASVLVGNHPLEYENWLVNAIEATRLRAKGKSRAPVFVNAWNEWAEGAVLEPSVECGFSYLEATKSAIRATSFKDFGREFARSRQFAAQCEATRRLIVIHAFYLNEFAQILEGLNNLTSDWALAVTAPRDLCASLRELLAEQPYEFLIFEVPNKGRDILPFMFLGTEHNFFGADWVLKLHTKKSPHRQDGATWLDSFVTALAQVAADPNHLVWNDASIGLAAPAQHIVPLDYYWGSNAERVTLMVESNLGKHDLANLITNSTYVAGSMFLISRALIEKVVTLPVSPASFEEEAGQIDGTTAHALERMFGVLAQAHGLAIHPIGGSVEKLAFEFAEPTRVDGSKIQTSAEQ